MTITSNTGVAISFTSGLGLGNEGGDYMRNKYINLENFLDFIATVLGGIFGTGLSILLKLKHEAYKNDRTYSKFKNGGL